MYFFTKLHEGVVSRQSLKVRMLYELLYQIATKGQPSQVSIDWMFHIPFCLHEVGGDHILVHLICDRELFMNVSAKSTKKT